jgi:xylan 1,4-beta-xylosidase
MKYINNPILRGFNPDPSIIRVDDDYYIATSTFEWFPGVQIHQSRDLINWRLITRPLNRVSQLDMKGNPSSGGVWAPCLTYDKGVFYLMYSDVKTLFGAFKDTHNYMVTATDILGDWSDPIYLNSSGFDPSMFHDDDGRKWLLNMVWDYRKGRKRFGGILLQEYSQSLKALTGPIYNIFKDSELGTTEGPHLYKINGWYYLLTAEGGTGRNHAVTVARSKCITGPYEVDPENPMLSSKHNHDNPLQKAGHADIVQTQNGEWYMVHLCGRPLPEYDRSILGRETCIQKVSWNSDGWLRLDSGGIEPLLQVPAPDPKEHPWPEEPERDDFTSEKLNIHFQTWRIPLGEDSLSLKEKPGFLRLKGRESLSSKHHQSLVARRQQSFYYTAQTCLEFDPDTYQQMAGLICLYDTQNFYYLYISFNETKGKVINIMTSDNGAANFPLDEEISIQGSDRVFLRVGVDYDRLQFFYSTDEKIWDKIGPSFDATILADEHCNEGRFTGAFVGLCCQDLSGRRMPADFDYFIYQERNPDDR